MLKEKKAVAIEAVSVMNEVGKTMKFDGSNIILEGEVLYSEWKATWKRVKAEIKKSKKDKSPANRKSYKVRYTDN